MRLLEGLRSGRESLREVVAALEADVEAMYELIDRYDGERSNAQENTFSEQEQQTGNAVCEIFYVVIILTTACHFGLQ